MAAAFLCGVAVSTSAQNSGGARIAPESGFTIPVNVQTPIVLNTQPDAACDLHAEGVSDAAQTLRVYANPDGYIKVHMKARQESQDTRLQLDCAAAGEVITYPLHLRSGSAPTDDMPAPRTVVPTPKGLQVVPALTEADAQRLSDQELLRRGYGPRPDPVASPDNYTRWLDLFSQPSTLLPPHSLNRPDITHQGTQGDPDLTASSSSIWSGLQAHTTSRTYMAVESEWVVPEIPAGEPNNVTFSFTWVGLDGNGAVNLVQAGTNQAYVDIDWISVASYSTWSEVLPNQPTSQGVNLSVNPSDTIFVQVWIGDANGSRDPNGAYAWFWLYDINERQEVQFSNALNGTFNGNDAEWIMERPQQNGVPTQLSEYVVDEFTGAYALPTTGNWVTSGEAANRQYTMYNEDWNFPDNNELSYVVPVSPTAMIFVWLNFH
ncbi:MAG: G1 family glutamic endopeptidase [Terriglobales bacterium]